MSEPLQISLPAGLVEQIAARVADLLQAEGPEDGEVRSPWLDFEGACAYLGFSRDALYKLTAASAIPVRKKLGGQGLRFHRDELDGWMEVNYPRLDRAGFGGAEVGGAELWSPTVPRDKPAAQEHRR
jgi:excisionase family DNA binding protein